MPNVSFRDPISRQGPVTIKTPVSQVLQEKFQTAITPPVAPMTEEPVSAPVSYDIHKLGSITTKYEAGKAGPAAISPRAEYGTYQLSTVKGTLPKFLTMHGYADEFRGTRPGTESFNRRWRELAKNPEFVEAQHSFIEKTHFEPAREFANRLKIPNTPAINEALWSASVQHGGWRTIVRNAGITSGMSEREMVSRLYDARVRYVEKLGTFSRKTKQVLKKRYMNEKRDVLNIIEGE